MPVITLTTDTGYKDFYVAVIKGGIISRIPDCNIIDITHQIEPFDIQRAAFILKNSYKAFPKGTVHLVGVNAIPEWQQPLVALKADGHFFTGADNGIFSLMELMPELIVELDHKQGNYRSFPAADILKDAACSLALGEDLAGLGNRKDGLFERTMFRPVSEPTVLRGTVIHVDSYGNVITNITRELFDSVGQGRKFQISLRRSDYNIDEISRHYNDVPEGEKLALFGFSGQLEIAMNKGNAAGLLNMRLNDAIRIEFTDDQNS
jgi:S-adenosylmethionine hydrolase